MGVFFLGVREGRESFQCLLLREGIKKIYQCLSSHFFRHVDTLTGFVSYVDRVLLYFIVKGVKASEENISDDKQYIGHG